MDEEEKQLQIKLAKEERELTIKLAKLQADFQFLLTLTIGSFAVLFSLLVYTNQMYNTLPNSNPLKNSYGGAGVLTIIALLFFVVFFSIKTRQIKKRNG